ncbi:MAG: hypothetical protein M1814_003659 [Vezdaea aestivalis]|nr:MAG: hypothetical protein M1814_003659 [Vezdaea aestivalis]
MAAARSLAEALHQHGMHLVYGGGTLGLMGEVARTLVSLSGPEAVHGIIPAALVEKEQAAESCKLPLEQVYGKMTVVPDMHTRKGLMAKTVMEGGKGGGFVALPGGFGTLEELMEITTWNSLGIHDQAICMYNVEGYYDHLVDWIWNAVDQGMIKPSNGAIISEAKTAEGVIEALRTYKVSEDQMKLDWTSR